MNLYTAPGVKLEESGPVSGLSLVTVCVKLSLFVQVTIVPFLIVILDGVKDMFSIDTALVAGALVVELVALLLVEAAFEVLLVPVELLLLLRPNIAQAPPIITTAAITATNTLFIFLLSPLSTAYYKAYC